MSKILIKEFGRSNIANRLWYCMEETEKADIPAVFGDRVIVIKTNKKYIMGDDATWYEVSVSED